MTDNAYDLETLSIHAGCGPDSATGARTIPVHQSTAFVFQDAEQAANLFALREAGFVYSRLTNPTVGALEEKLAAMDGGSAATCTSSGHAAQMMVMAALLTPGDEVASSQKLYGGSLNQFAVLFPARFGWKSPTFSPTDPDGCKAVITDKTRAIFLESLSNPEGVVADLEAFAKIAEDAGIPLVVDNTMATPYLCKPKDFGANIVTYSTTKFISGHGNAMGGAVVDCGNFDWIKYGDKYPELGKPNPGYGDINFAETFGPAAFAIHNHAVGLRDIGCNQQPMNAYLTFVGSETLSLRMAKHCENALALAKFLKGHDKVSFVNYAGLPDSPNNANAKKYMKGQGGAVFTFGLKGGYDAGVKLIESVKLFSHLANIGDTRSLIIHPASTTHSQLDDAGKEKAGAGPEVVRISVGIENYKDIEDDLAQALAQV